jgi:hypothetical protein
MGYVGGAYSIHPYPPHPIPPLIFVPSLSPLSRGESNRQAAQWRQACPTTRKRTCVSGQQSSPI